MVELTRKKIDSSSGPPYGGPDDSSPERNGPRIGGSPQTSGEEQQLALALGLMTLFDRMGLPRQRRRRAA